MWRLDGKPVWPSKIAGGGDPTTPPPAPTSAPDVPGLVAPAGDTPPMGSPNDVLATTPGSLTSEGASPADHHPQEAER